jgi:KUP system potassium uptake protein
VNEEIPWVDTLERVRVTKVNDEIFQVCLRFGFREEPDVPSVLPMMEAQGLLLEPLSTTYFVARSTIVDGAGEMPVWRAILFGWMMRQSESAASYFGLPPNQVVELGTQVML